VRLNPAVEDAPGYPFLRLAEARRAAQARGADVIDLSLGQPTDPAPQIVRDALAQAAATLALCDYPSGEGLPALRHAIADWIARRFGVALDPAREILPTLGAKEPIALLARLFARPGDAIALATPGYPVPQRSAHAAGLQVAPQVLTAATSWLPDPDAIPWGRAAIVWVTNPHNPTGAIAPLALLEELARRCRRSGAILALDETYSEFWFGGDPPPSGLQLGDRSGVIVFHSLSKRSGLAGLRSGFMAGDEQIVRRVKRHRADIGTTPPALVQQASVAAWSDDGHVVQARARYAAKRVVLAEAAQRGGLQHAGGAGGIFLWLRVPDGDDEGFARRLLERSLLVVPGSYLGAGGEGHLRVSLTPTAERIVRAAEVLGGVATLAAGA
jgi:aspartate/methionine/tyrosine aminotransferase